MSLSPILQVVQMISGERISFSRMLPRSTMVVKLGGIGGWIFFSETAFALSYVGVVWHDEPGHCPTWSQGCRCDVEPT